MSATKGYYHDLAERFGDGEVSEEFMARLESGALKNTLLVINVVSGECHEIAKSWVQDSPYWDQLRAIADNHAHLTAVGIQSAMMRGETFRDGDYLRVMVIR